MKKFAASRRFRLVASLAAGGLALGSLPTAGLALGVIDGSSALVSFTPAGANTRLARMISGQSAGRMLRFTPADATARAGRSVTVAVRVDARAARALSVRGALQPTQDQLAGDPAIRIAPSRYNLGIARGYQGFVRTPAAALAPVVSDVAIPDLAQFKPSPGVRPDTSRFTPRFAMEEEAKAGAAPRTMDSRSDQRVDVGGSYRLTRNLDVTAGVRYSQERDRLAPLADPTRQDSQAVYVGTQFRF